MTLYRKFGQALAILCCIAMLGMAVVLVISGGVSSIDEDTGEKIYFIERANFQGAAFVGLAFLLSAICNACAVDWPIVAAGISLLPLIMTFYEMAVGNLNFVVAAVILLFALIHVASNALAAWDAYQWKKKQGT